MIDTDLAEFYHSAFEESRRVDEFLIRKLEKTGTFCHRCGELLISSNQVFNLLKPGIQQETLAAHLKVFRGEFGWARAHEGGLGTASLLLLSMFQTDEEMEDKNVDAR